MNMKDIASTLFMLLIVAVGPLVGEEIRKSSPEQQVSKSIADVVATIRGTLESKTASRGELRQTAEVVRGATKHNQWVQMILGDTLETGAGEGSLRLALGDTADILSFQPIEEAPLPEGFPALTPVGEIRVNPYPSYRIARTATAPNDSLAFWRLFRHIQARNIAMTAPVEMTYADGADDPREAEMAFLYRSVEQGEVGQDGKIEVIDVPAQMAVSIGWRGDTSATSVEQARELLETWLEEHANEYKRAGKLRVMGHNSPFVSAQKRYFEVQISIEATTPR